MLPRISEKIDATGDCWQWTGAIKSNGYGNIWIDSQYRNAHRVVYEILVGVTSGDLDHLCRNRACVNPDHLQPVSRSENLLRGRAGRARGHSEHCRRGHKMEGDNLYVSPKGLRRCRECDKIRKGRA